MTITKIINQILSPGPALFMPIIFFIFIIIIKIIKKDAITWVSGIRASITIGIAFVAIGIVISFLINTITPSFKALSEFPGINFGSLDLGWAPISAVAWAWNWAFLMFPIQIIINLVMLLTKQTRTLNIDMWNVWNKILTAVLLVFVLNETILAIVLGFIIGGIQVILELKNADFTYKRVRNLSGLDNVACPHGMLLFNIVALPLDKLLNKVPFFAKGNAHLKNQSNFGSITSLKYQKFAWLLENDIVGILIGILLICITLPFNTSAWAEYVILPIQLGAALILFPLATKLFSKAISPISFSMQKIISSSKRFNNLYIGLDWPFLAGNNKMWIFSTIMIPFSIAYAFLFSLIPGIKMVFPLGGIVNICLAVSLLVTTQANLRKMVMMGIIFTPIYLFFGAWAADSITALAIQARVPNINFDVPITWSGFESPVFRFIAANIFVLFINFQSNAVNIMILIIAPLWLILLVYYFVEMRAEANEIEKPWKGIFNKIKNWNLQKNNRKINLK